MTFEAAHRAIKRGQVETLEAGLHRGLDLNATNKYGWTLLMLTALEGSTQIGKLLLERGANLNALNVFGENALSLAAHSGHLTFVVMLKSAGATCNVKPHGHELENWVRMTSGLSTSKIDAILSALLA